MARFDKREKLSPRYIKPFKVFERVGTIVYQLVLLLSLLSVHAVFYVSMLWKYILDPTHVVDWEELVVDADETFEEGLICIMDSRDQVLQSKTVRVVKVLWRHRGVEEVTWEREDTMRANYLFCSRKKYVLVIDIKLMLHMHGIVCAMCENFKTKLF